MNRISLLFFCGLVAAAWSSQANAQEQSRRASNPVISFSWIYEHQPEPGKRVWVQKADRRWYEYYPSGREAKVFDQARNARVESCSGSVVSQSAGTALEVFIPDVGCSSMLARFRNGEGPWSIMGKMNEINTASAPETALERGPKGIGPDCSKPEQIKSMDDVDACVKAIKKL